MIRYSHLTLLGPGCNVNAKGYPVTCQAGRTEWVVSATSPATLLMEERPGTYCTGCWVGLGAGMNGCGQPHML